MTSIIERAETIIRLSNPRRTQPQIIGVIAELVKTLKSALEENQHLQELRAADRSYALELHDELQYFRRHQK